MSDIAAATRARRPGWRDPRLWIGVVIVAASVVAGARLLAAADDTVGVWVATGRHGAGDQLAQADLAAVRIHAQDEDTLDDYFTVEDTLPSDLVLSRGIEPGELLPRASIGSVADVGVVEVPVAVEPEQVPASVSTGAVVDVYVVAASGAGQQAPGATTGTSGATSGAGTSGSGGPALAGVTVLDAPALADSFGTTGKRQLVLAVPEGDAAGFFSLLAASQTPTITVVRRG